MAARRSDRAHAAGSSLTTFLVARSTLGLGEAGVFPASIKAVAEWFPKKERSLAIGIFNAGTNFGAILTPLVVPWITIHWGWRWAFLITGAIGFAWLTLWLLLYDRPEESRRVSKSELDHIRSDPVTPTKPMKWISLVFYREAWAFIAAKFLTDPIWWFYLFWIPDFLIRKHGLTLLQIGVPIMVIYVISDLGSVGGGWLSKDYPASCRALRASSFGCLSCRESLDSGSHHRHRSRCTSGIFGQPLYHHFRHLSGARGRVGGRNGRNGRSDRRHAHCKNSWLRLAVDWQLHDSIFHGWFRLSDCLGCYPTSRTAARPGKGFVECRERH